MRTFAIGLSGTALGMLVALGSVNADVALTGKFIATQACPAFQSFRKSTNPGDVKVEPNDTYEVIAENKPDATHYRLVIEGAEPEERWVSASCGHIVGTNQPAQEASPIPGAMTSARESGERATHLLALGWEPTFCESHRDKAECRELTSSGFDATHLSLHGLWPQPRGTEYCNVPSELKELDETHDWNDLPEPDISPDTLKRLSAVMPGVESNLQRHEWFAHGTCFGGSADDYFARAAALAETVDASAVSQLFAGNVGKSLSADAIRAAFDDAFGPGSGARVTVSCRGHGESRTITELRVYLAGDMKGNAGLGDLIRAAPAVPPGCPSGLVEQVRP